MNRNRPIVGSLVLLDANVLYPINFCDFILTASSHQLLARPIESTEILDEATRNTTADRPDLRATSGPGSALRSASVYRPAPW